MEPSSSPEPDHQEDQPKHDEIKHPGHLYQIETVKPKKSTKKPLLIIAVVILLAALGAGAYLMIGHKKKEPAKQATTTQTQKVTVPAAKDTNTGIAEYTAPADGLNLSFSYPSSWTVNPPSGQGGSTITVTSPLVSLPDASTGGDVTGKVIVTIRGDTSNIKEMSGAKVTAPQDPVQYAYKAPTAAQHQYFYVSFLQFATPATAQGAFQEVAITGINQIPKGTAVTADLLGEVDPLVTASFNKCTANICTEAEQAPVGITGLSWQNNETMLQVQALFESLKFN